MPSAVKLSDELVKAARNESQTWSRSMTQQIEHWARIGRAVERSGAIDPARIRAALAADLAFDALATEERLVVLGELEKRVFRPEGDRELSRRLLSGPVPPSTVDARGHIRKVRGVSAK